MIAIPYKLQAAIAGSALLLLAASHMTGRMIGAANARAACAEDDAAATADAIAREEKRRAAERDAAIAAEKKLAAERRRLDEILKGLKHEGPAVACPMPGERMRDDYEAIFGPEPVQPARAQS